MNHAKANLATGRCYPVFLQLAVGAGQVVNEQSGSPPYGFASLSGSFMPFPKPREELLSHSEEPPDHDPRMVLMPPGNQQPWPVPLTYPLTAISRSLGQAGLSSVASVTVATTSCPEDGALMRQLERGRTRPGEFYEELVAEGLAAGVPLRACLPAGPGTVTGYPLSSGGTTRTASPSARAGQGRPPATSFRGARHVLTVEQAPSDYVTILNAWLWVI